MRSRNRAAANAGLLAIVLIWGLNFPVMKVALDQVPPLALNALRFPLAAATLAVLLRLQGRRLVPRRRDWGKVALLGALGHVVFQICFVYSLDLTLTGNAALLLATSPVWVVLLGTAMGKERFNPWALWGSLITLAGMALLIFGDGGGGESGDGASAGGNIYGDLLMVGAAVSWALYTVLGRRAVKRHGALEVTGWAMWAGAPVLVATGMPDLWRIGLGSISLAVWGAAAYAGVLAVAVAYLLWYRAVGVLGQSSTAVYQNLVPVVALVAAWLWLDETPGVEQAAGTVVILVGLLVARRERRRRGPGTPVRR